MGKMKTHSGSKKRFKITAKGRVKRGQAFKSHILTKKTTKRKRHLRKNTLASKADEPRIREMMPYK